MHKDALMGEALAKMLKPKGKRRPPKPSPKLDVATLREVARELAEAAAQYADCVRRDPCPSVPPRDIIVRFADRADKLRSIARQLRSRATRIERAAKRARR